ncbi:Uncharacterised protein [Vibrio cholerae]|nr:Uncharacterised protein [Vibrio cholerae]
MPPTAFLHWPALPLKIVHSTLSWPSAPVQDISLVINCAALSIAAASAKLACLIDSGSKQSVPIQRTGPSQLY